jgi:hypothetical protein
MSQQFDEFSKHLATKRSRRGVLKLLSAGLFGVVGSAVLRGGADAKTAGPGGTSSPVMPHINQTYPYQGLPYLNQGNGFPFRLPYVNQSYPDINQTYPYLNENFPYINAQEFKQTLRERLLEFFGKSH